jgi:osmoprotectant transport system ATP-binding protein
MARRYPYQLSGGQQQRVGVARALAADPPVLLMDEPFSAVDPIVRSSLQDELIRLQNELHKTVVLVTHDVEEAIKVGDQVAVFYPHGKIAQLDTPQHLLGSPADEYVENFLGFDRGIRRLAFFSAGQLDLETGTVLPADTTVEQARAAAQRCGEPWVLVTDGNRRPQGWYAVSDLDHQAGQDALGVLSLSLAPLGHTFQVGRDSLRAALDATVLSRTGRAAGVDDQGRVVGITTYERLRTAIQTAEQAGLDGNPDQPVFREGRTTPEAQQTGADEAAEPASRAGEGVRPS